MDVDRLLPDGPLIPTTRKNGELRLTVSHDETDMVDATHLALRAARIRLWQDLWARSENIDTQIEVRAKQIAGEQTHRFYVENERLRRVIRGLRRTLAERD